MTNSYSAKMLNTQSNYLSSKNFLIGSFGNNPNLNITSALNSSIWTTYNNNNANNSISSAQKTLNTISTITAGFSIAQSAVSFAGAVKSLLPKGNAGKGPEAQGKTDLENAITTAEKTGDWTPVQNQVVTAKQLVTTIDSEVDKLDSEIKNITETQIKDQEAAITALDADDKKVETEKDTKLAKITEGETAQITKLEGQISSIKAANPSADVSAIEAQIKEVKKQAEEARTKAKNDCSDAKKRNEVKREEYKQAIADLKKTVTEKTAQKGALKTKKAKALKDIAEAEAKLAKRTLAKDDDSEDKKSETEVAPKTISGISNSRIANGFEVFS